MALSMIYTTNPIQSFISMVRLNFFKISFYGFLKIFFYSMFNMNTTIKHWKKIQMNPNGKFVIVHERRATYSINFVWSKLYFSEMKL